MKLIDVRTLCDDGKHQMRGALPKGVTLHMFGVPGIHDACGIARFYRANPEWTGGKMPYTVVVHHDGALELALPWDEIGPHALRWSSPTIGVVSLGDFNEAPPTPAQWNSAADIVSELVLALGLDPMSKTHLAGHTERPNATHNPGKVCPGKFWDMDKFRRDVRDITREAAIQRVDGSLVVS